MLLDVTMAGEALIEGHLLLIAQELLDSHGDFTIRFGLSLFESLGLSLILLS